MIGLFAGIFSDHEIRSVEIDGIDTLGLDEFEDLHGVAGGGRDALDFVFIDDDVAVLFDFVTLDQFAALHHALADGAIGLLFDAAAAFLMDLVETDAFGAGRREQA